MLLINAALVTWYIYLTGTSQEAAVNQKAFGQSVGHNATQPYFLQIF